MNFRPREGEKCDGEEREKGRVRGCAGRGILLTSAHGPLRFRKKLSIARARAISATLARMGWGDTGWPRELYYMLRAAGMIRYRGQLCDVQEAYSTLTGWIAQGNQDIAQIDDTMVTLLHQPRLGWLEQKSTLECKCGAESVTQEFCEVLTLRIPASVRDAKEATVTLDQLFRAMEAPEKVGYACKCGRLSGTKTLAIVPHGPLVIDITRQYYDLDEAAGIPSTIDIQFDPDLVALGDQVYTVQTLVIWVPAHYYVVQRNPDSSNPRQLFFENNNDIPATPVSISDYGKHLKMMVLYPVEDVAQVAPRPTPLKPAIDHPQQRAVRSWDRLVRAVRRSQLPTVASRLAEALLEDEIDPNHRCWSTVKCNNAAANRGEMLVSLPRLRHPQRSRHRWLQREELYLNDLILSAHALLLNERPNSACYSFSPLYFARLYDMETKRYQYDHVKRWAKARPAIGDLQLLAIPIHWKAEKHFTLAVIDFTRDRPRIEYYDPLYGQDDVCTTASEIVFPILTRLVQDLAKTDDCPAAPVVDTVQFPATTWQQVPTLPFPLSFESTLHTPSGERDGLWGHGLQTD